MLLPRGHDAPPDLLRGMRRRGVELREVNDAASAMVALARQRFLAVILVEPDTLAEGTELMRAVRRYHRRVHLWRYRADEEPRLTRCGPDAAEADGAALPSIPEDRAAAPPPQRLGRMEAEDALHRSDAAPAPGPIDEAEPDGAEDRPAEVAEAPWAEDDEDEGGAEAEGSDQVMLSAEELSMLLRRREGEEREGGPSA